MKENNTTSFFFEEGEIFDHDSGNWNPKDSLGINLINAILGPVIDKDKLSGKIELTILSRFARINYLNIRPMESVTVLMEMIREADLYGMK